MAASQTKCSSFLILVLICFPHKGDSQNASVVSLGKDMQLLLNQTKQAYFKVENWELLQEPVVIDFYAKNQGADQVAKLIPSSIFISNVSGGDFFIKIMATDVAGRATVLAKNASSPLVNLKDAFVRVTVQHSEELNVLSQIIGWIYFVAWSVSFYPQIFYNFERKSVIGLSFDFVALNIVGFVLYSAFNVGLYWISPIRAEYFSRHPTGINPVQLNDVIFSLHAVFACAVTILQCIIYERGNQSVSKVSKGVGCVIVFALSLTLILVLSSVLKPLDFLYVCSYVKLFITLVKYVPQAYLNYRRKSTDGWSIGNILLDFIGGILSIGQMFALAYNENDWGSLFGDPTKFGLGLFSVMFDILFMLQHYVFYRHNFPSEELINDCEEQNDLEEAHDSDSEP